METNNQKLENDSRTFHETFDGAWRRILRDPYVGWTITLAFAAAVGISLVGLGYIAYSRVTGKLSAPIKTPDDTRVVLDENELRAVLKAMNERAVEHAALSKTYSGPSDPSK